LPESAHCLPVYTTRPPRLRPLTGVSQSSPRLADHLGAPHVWKPVSRCLASMYETPPRMLTVSVSLPNAVHSTPRTRFLPPSVMYSSPPSSTSIRVGRSIWNALIVCVYEPRRCLMPNSTCLVCKGLNDCPSFA